MKYTTTFLILIWSLVSFAQERAESRTENLATLRSNLEAILDNQPYKAEEHTTIKAYFSELGSLVEDVKLYSKYRKRFNKFLRSSGVDTFCQAAYLDQKKWSTLVKNCTKNNFFLCTEEVRFFSDKKAELKQLVDEDIKTQLETLADCR